MALKATIRMTVLARGVTEKGREEQVLSMQTSGHLDDRKAPAEEVRKEGLKGREIK